MDINSIIQKTISLEGEYSNDDLDRGGETIYGISRVFHPNEEIWEHIDRWKKGMMTYLQMLEIVKPLAIGFYKTKFWDESCDFFVETYEPMAALYFDTKVNLGARGCGKLLQRTINMFADSLIAVDGIIGKQTKGALSGCPVSSAFFDKFTLERVKHYVSVCRRQGSNMRFLLGWLNRTLSFQGEEA